MGTLRFQVAVSVRYMRDVAPSQASLTPSLTKEVRVMVVELPDGPTDRAPSQATLRRVVTPASIGAQNPEIE
jgi:hypothetical protein